MSDQPICDICHKPIKPEHLYTIVVSINYRGTASNRTYTIHYNHAPSVMNKIAKAVKR